MSLRIREKIQSLLRTLIFLLFYIPVLPIFCVSSGNSSVVERHLAKVDVASSSLVSRSSFFRDFQVPFFIAAHSLPIPTTLAFIPKKLYFYIYPVLYVLFFKINGHT